MAGQVRYPIEHAGTFIAEEGDIVYVPIFTFHYPRFHGAGPSCRLAMNGYPNIGHLFAAAGVSGLIKSTIAHKHSVLPPRLNFE